MCCSQSTTSGHKRWDGTRYLWMQVLGAGAQTRYFNLYMVIYVRLPRRFHFICLCFGRFGFLPAKVQARSAFSARLLLNSHQCNIVHTDSRVRVKSQQLVSGLRVAVAAAAFFVDFRLDKFPPLACVYKLNFVRLTPTLVEGKQQHRGDYTGRCKARGRFSPPVVAFFCADSLDSV